MERKDLRPHRINITNLLNEYGKEHKLQFHLGGITFSDYDFSVKLTATEAGDKTEAERVQFGKWCGMAKCTPCLTPDVYGTEITWGGKRYKVVGVKPNSPKYGILAEDMNTGKRFKLPFMSVGRQPTEDNDLSKYLH